MNASESLLFFLLISMLSSCSNFSERPVEDRTTRIEVSRDTQCNGIAITKESRNTINPGLITADHKYYHRGCYEKIIKQTLKDTDKPFVLFVHGRGRHPGKEFKKKLIKQIQSYDVTVLMFTWPSWEGVNRFPIEKALNSSDDLAIIFDILSKTKSVSGSIKPYTLLTHSMGSIVLEGYANKTNYSNKIFNNIIVNASASSNHDHAWIDNIDIAKRIYIMVNKNDKALKCLEGNHCLCRIIGLHESPRLGRWTSNNTNIDSASKNAIYVDLEKIVGKKHPYYLNKKKNSKAYSLFSLVLNGGEADFSDYTEIVKNHIYKAK